MTSQASSARLASFQRIDAKPSGDSTEYTAFSSMMTRLPTASASAPPEPPSPQMTLITGTVSELMSSMERAMASP